MRILPFIKMIVCLCGVLNSLFVSSQQKINGQVLNRAGESISIALIHELSSQKVLTGNFIQADSLGYFSVVLERGMGLYVTALGYESQTLLPSDTTTFLKILLNEKSDFHLKEVDVVAYRKAVEVKSDRIVYDMSVNPSKTSGALEALRYVPMVVADENRFEIVGKDKTLVYINNRKSNMDTSGLLSYLKSLPSDRIQNIEVITSPDSRFRGEGNFGVIHIVLKNNEFEGLKGYLTGRVWKSHRVKESGDLNLNFSKGSLLTALSVGLGNYSTWKETNTESFYLKNKLYTQEKATYDMREPEFYLNLQSDYQLNKYSTIGIVFNANYIDSHGDEDGITSFQEDRQSVIDSLIGMNVYYKHKRENYALNLNYRYDDNDQFVIVDLDYLNNKNISYSRNDMNRLNPETMHLLTNYRNFEQEVPQKIRIVSGKLEYGRKIKERMSLNMGLDTYYSDVDDDNSYRVLNGDVYVDDPLKSNRFGLQESTSALFGQFDWQMSHVLSTSLGVRLEYTYYKGFQEMSDDLFKTDYFRPLPTLNISYNPTKKYRMNYNLSYRVERPSFSSLNPFVQYTSPTNYSTGNPFLKPINYWSQSLQFSLLNKYFLSASLNLMNDVLSPIQIQKENGLIENTLTNMGTQKIFRVSWGTTQRYWNARAMTNLNVNYEWKQVQGSSISGLLDYNHNSFLLSMQNSLMISKKQDLNLDFGGKYSTKQRTAYMQYPSSLNLNLQLRKGFNNLQISLYTNLSYYIYDKKIQRDWKLIRDNEYLAELELSRGENASIGLSLSFNFGNSKVNEVRYRDSSASSLKSRID